MLNWDDLRVFITAARAKSFIAAGQRLRMNPTTVARRITRLESRLTSTLLVRSRLGLHLTSAGARLVEAGIGVEAAMGLLNHRDKASSSQQQGMLRAYLSMGRCVVLSLDLGR